MTMWAAKRRTGLGAAAVMAVVIALAIASPATSSIPPAGPIARDDLQLINHPSFSFGLAELTAELVATELEPARPGPVRLALEAPATWPFSRARDEKRVWGQNPILALSENLSIRVSAGTTGLTTGRTVRLHLGDHSRHYDPELGRFISPDPLGYVDGPSMYQFAGYSPFNKTDPLGLYQTDIHYYAIYYLSRLTAVQNSGAISWQSPGNQA